jgi:hypothetical protein
MCAGNGLSPQAKAIIDRLRRTHHWRLFEALCEFHGVPAELPAKERSPDAQTDDNAVLQRALWRASEKLAYERLSSPQTRAVTRQAVTGTL